MLQKSKTAIVEIQNLAYQKISGMTYQHTQSEESVRARKANLWKYLRPKKKKKKKKKFKNTE